MPGITSTKLQSNYPDGMRTTAALSTIVIVFTVRDVLAAPPGYRDGFGPKDAPACKAAGGEWSRSPMMQTPYCRLRYPDGGKQCARSSDCRSQICVIENSNQRRGKCHGESDRFATFWYLDENGKPEKISVE
jgi:hypothetical protein